MKAYLGVDLGSTTTKAVLLDEQLVPIGRGITNSRSDYHLAAELAQEDALIAARFTILERALGEAKASLKKRLFRQFRRQQYLAQLAALRAACVVDVQANAARAPTLEGILEALFEDMEREARRPQLTEHKSEFFRDRAGSDYARFAERHGRTDPRVSFDTLMGLFDRCIIKVEAGRVDLSFGTNIARAVEEEADPALEQAVEEALRAEIEVGETIGTGYGRALLPFPKENIRSEILCHGLGAHAAFPGTRTVLDIGGQDTKAIQVDASGVVTGFQMNDRCAAGCGRYLGYIADEMNLGLHELGPLAMTAEQPVKINSTCTVFAGAELRDRLSAGQKREEILSGLHRSIVLRAMALLARSGGVTNELTFTGGVASNVAAVAALDQLVRENYGQRTLNISPTSIYTGAHGAALYAARAGEGRVLC